MCAEYGLGIATPSTRRMLNEMLYGTRAAHRTGTPADRLLSATVADLALPVTVVIEPTHTPETNTPMGSAAGIGRLVAQHAEMMLGGQEG